SALAATAEYRLQDLTAAPWFVEISQEIHQMLEQIAKEEQECLPLLSRRLRELERQQEGWRISLGNPSLPLSVRTTVESDLAHNAEQIQEVNNKLTMLDRQRQQVHSLVNPQQIIQRLNNLAQLLASDNPTRSNLELSQHIDVISCNENGRVRVRMCRLGALAE